MMTKLVAGMVANGIEERDKRTRAVVAEQRTNGETGHVVHVTYHPRYHKQAGLRPHTVADATRADWLHG